MDCVFLNSIACNLFNLRFILANLVVSLVFNKLINKFNKSDFKRYITFLGSFQQQIV